MRVLIFSMEYPPMSGGGSSYAVNLVNSLVNSFPETEVIVMTGGEAESVEKINSQLTIYRFNSCNKAHKHTALSAELIDDFKNTVNAVQPDTIHAFHTIPIMVTKITHESIRIPYVLTQHRTPEPSWMPIKLDGKGELAELAYKLSISDRWIAPSKFFRSNLEKHKISPQHIKTVYPSVDPKLFKYVDFDYASKKLRIMYDIDPKDQIVTIPVVDRPRKDIKFCLDAINELEKKNKISIFITGVNEDSDSFLSLRNSYPDLRFVPHSKLEYETIPIIMAGSNLVVMCSKYEGFGISCIEALATGANTAIRSSPGLSEVLELVGSAYDFSTIDQLSALIQDNVNTSHLDRENQSKHVHTTFSAQKQAIDHMAVYEDIAAKDYNPTMAKVQEEFHDVFNRKEHLLKNIDSVFVSGSVAKNDYIKGWSDIDIVVICQKSTLSKEELESIQQLQIKLTNTYHCKVGVDYISSQYLLSKSASELIPQHDVPNLILFHEKNTEQITKGMLYKSTDYIFPFFSGSQFQYLSLDDYKELCRGLVHEALFRSDGSLATSVKVLRIITKTSVYLLRMRALIQDGRYVIDYDQLINEHMENYDTSSLKEVYGLARNQTLDDKLQVEELINKTLDCFNRLVTLL
jgi:glycosyltransferase involved in cell wall biosynthesis/predicted nucleotidyltransferase